MSIVLKARLPTLTWRVNLRVPHNATQKRTRKTKEVLRLAILHHLPLAGSYLYNEAFAFIHEALERL